MKNKENNDPNRYDDIINLPHFVSKNRNHMSLSDRAAQFAPFDALTGYSEAIKETGRQTEKEKELGEYELNELDMRLKIIESFIKDRPLVKIKYFILDEIKDGGTYQTASFNVKKINRNKRTLISTNDEEYDLDYIFSIESDVIEKVLNDE